MRINRYLAVIRGIATRKGADALVAKGLVTINGKRAVLGDKIHENDAVEVAQRGDKTNEKIYLAYNKPIGIVTTNAQGGEIDILRSKKLPKGVFPVGRLDKDSYGLIILTNDGRITDRLLSPKYDHEKEYEVIIDRAITQAFLKHMAEGVRIGEMKDAYMTERAQVKMLGIKKFRIILTEGKKHQIRRMCDALGYHVQDLKRIRIMNIKLGDLSIGGHRTIEGTELADFMQLLGL